MPMQRYKPEQIVTVLRQVEVQMASGKTAPQACKEAGIHTPTYYRWRKEYGGAEGGAGQADEGVGAREYAAEATGGGVVAGEASFEGCGGGKLLSPERRHSLTQGVSPGEEVTNQPEPRMGRQKTHHSAAKNLFRPSGARI